MLSRLAALRAKPTHLVIGLMSGTSADGVDAALCELSGQGRGGLKVNLLAEAAQAYPVTVRRRILNACQEGGGNSADLCALNFQIAEVFAAAANAALETAGLGKEAVDLIGSHGQTIWHIPPRGGDTGVPASTGATLQLGEPAVIAERTGIPVVSNFRTRDMAAGGQGAPLVPLVDYLLLRDARRGTVALNIGGIANFTVIPANARPEEVFGFDTGPGNMVIDGLVRNFSHGRKTYDAGGRWAARGQAIEPLLAEVLRLPFFRRQPPKSAGREQFGQWFGREFFLKRRSAKAEDLLRTATELTARSIADAVDRFVLGSISIHRLIVSGGGAHNRLLVSRLSQLLPRLRVQLSDASGLPADAKEAIAFAVLADRTMHGLPGNLPSVTGARRAVVLGRISRP